MNEEEIFHEALSRRLPEERASYLQEACAGNPALRASIEALLRANIGASGFLEGPSGAVTVDAPITEHPGTVIGPYKLLEQIGEGGFGVVFMAEQTQPIRRKVALKVLKPGMDTRQVIARFEAERQALALMDHPNIAHVFDGGETATGRPYFVMELVRGITITDFCDQNHLAVRQRLELFLSICQAVQHAHQKGVIHRDIKPTNVLVTLHDGVPVPKIIDFGIAKALGQQLTDKTLFTNFAQLIGTPLYMSPEQAELSGLDVDTRSDIYSLGVLLYELLTGTTPFDKERLKQAGYDEIRRIIREEEPPKPSTRISTMTKSSPHAPRAETGPRSEPTTIETLAAQRKSDPNRLSQLVRGELDWIVMKCLEKDRNRRYETANGLARDIERYLHDEPVQACPPSAAYRFRKLVRRNRVLFAMITAVAATFLVATSVVTWKWWDAETARGREQKAKEQAFEAEKQARDERDRTARAERKARLGEADALIGQAHGIRLSRRPGQRFEALKALGKAAAIGRELEQPPSWFVQLRNEAIAALALPDIHITHEWEVDPATTWVEMNDDFSLYVCADDKGECTIHRLADPHSGVSGPHTPVWRLPPWGERVDAVFGAGQTLAIHGASGRFELWDLGSGNPVRRFKEEVIADPHSGWAFRMDGRLVALCHSDGSISVRDTATGERVYRLTAEKIIKGHPILHPTEPFVAIFHYLRREFQVADLRTGAIIAEPLPPWPGGNSSGAWSPDGRTLTVPSGDAEKIQQYAFDPSAPALKPTQVLDNPASGCPRIVYNRAGDRFVSRCWGTKGALFDAISGRVLFTTPEFPSAGPPLRFDATGKRLAAARTGDRKEKVGLWSVADAREYRTLVLAGGQEGLSQRLPAIHPGGRLAAMAQLGGVAIFDLESGRKLAEVPAPGANGQNQPSFAFDGAGNLLTNSMRGACRWPVPADAAEPGRVVIGPPERLPLKPGQNAIAASRDGQVIAQAMWAGYGMEGGGWILHPNSSEAREVDARASMASCDVTPDGRWVAFGVLASGGEAVKVYEAATAKCVFQFPSKQCYCRFTPDGHSLVTEVDGGQVYEVATWAPGPRLGPGIPWDATADVAVLGQPNGIYRLVELTSGRELARLEDPDQVTGAAAFTPDGSKLVVTAKDGLRVWDLRRIRLELGQLRLDWDGPPYFVDRAFQPDTDSSQSRKLALQVEVDPGDLDLSERIKSLSDRGYAHVSGGEWEKAAEDFARVIEGNPKEHWYWYISASLKLEMGDRQGYRRICKEMLARFGKNDKSEWREFVAFTCSLAPDAVSDFGPILKLADQAVTGSEQGAYPRWNVLTKGLAEYRAGHYASAVDWMNRFAPRVDGAHCDASVFAVVAMAKHRLGVAGTESSKPMLAEEARAALSHAQTILSQKMPDPKAGRPWGDKWPYSVDNFHDWLHAQILCREAEALLGMKEKKTHQKDTKDTKVKS
jgi:serine/threonine protein kinase/WD40 repeat protein